ncbi:MAG: hypothetical protein A2Y72_06810 [Chloroflexi bacterium RBG_13_53_26]|nr:MAG: hypothetical protein A2Y72_06810 [Chloroflexi bacterium RBG_13_53_26]
MSPILGIESCLDKQSKGTMLPLAGGPYKPVLDRVVVNVITMHIEVRVITDTMFPEPLLPNAPLTLPE